MEGSGDIAAPKTTFLYNDTKPVIIYITHSHLRAYLFAGENKKGRGGTKIVGDEEDEKGGS